MIEALCEFRFKSGNTWDLSVPGMIYDRLSKKYPRKQNVKSLQTSILQAPAGPRVRLDAVERLQFYREDDAACIQVGRDLLVANHMKPYPSWVQFIPLVEEALKTYRSVTTPEGFLRIGLRYINRIEIPGEQVKLEDYLDFFPFMGNDLPQELNTFIVGINLLFDDGRDNLRVQLVNVSSGGENAVHLMLDLDYFTMEAEEIDLESASTWLDTAHDRIEEVFEGCLKDSLRKIFQTKE